MQNPTTCKRLLLTLASDLPSGGGYRIQIPNSNANSRPSTPPQNNRTREVRSVLQDDDTDTDVSLTQLTDDEAESGSPDFQ